MKTLYIARHAKSSWKENVNDHQRSLNDRGESDVLLMSTIVAEKFKRPDVIITSDAKRALITARQYQKAFAVTEANFVTVPKLYDFTGGDALEVIKDCESIANRTIETLMIVGHNHALTHLVNKLGDQSLENLPTCGFVKINFDIETWITLQRGVTETILYPKLFKTEN